jgi:hypothetical protein
VDRAGIFHCLARLDDERLAEVFGREVLRLLVGQKLLCPEWEERNPDPGQDGEDHVFAQADIEEEKIVFSGLTKRESCSNC